MDSSADAGAAIGNQASVQGGGGAVGSYAESTNGGGAVGSHTTAMNGSGAVGYYATAVSQGFAGGYQAICEGTGAVQLGTGSNPHANTLQFRSYPLVDVNGHIPTDRLDGDYDIGVSYATQANSAGTATTAATATQATRAISDGNGNNIVNTYVDKSSAQTITGAKTFRGDSEHLIIQRATDSSAEEWTDLVFKNASGQKIGAVVVNHYNNNFATYLDCYTDGTWRGSMGVRYENNNLYAFGPSGKLLETTKVRYMHNLHFGIDGDTNTMYISVLLNWSTSYTNNDRAQLFQNLSVIYSNAHVPASGRVGLSNSGVYTAFWMASSSVMGLRFISNDGVEGSYTRDYTAFNITRDQVVAIYFGM